MMDYFTPAAWFWNVAGSAFWSSADGIYVDEDAVDHQRLTRIASEAELDEVLRQYGLVSPIITASDVKHEAQRRIIVLTGAESLQSTLIRQLNALMRATELTNLRAQGETLSQEEEAEAAALEGLAGAIKHIRTRSNVIEAMDPIPTDYRADAHWA